MRRALVGVAAIAAVLTIAVGVERVARADALSHNALSKNALAYGASGIWIGGRVVFDKPVDAAAYDAAQDLVWFTHKGTLQVLDLRADELAPVVIAKKFPDGAFEIQGASVAEHGTLYAGVYPVIVVGAKPKIASGAGAYGGIWEDQDEVQIKALKKIKLVGKKWLKKQKARKPRFTRPDAPAELPKVKLPAGMASCDDEELCGTAVAFGGTGLALVTTSHSCGDACHTECVLHDPKTGLYLTPDATSGKWSKTAAGGACDGWRVDGATGAYLGGALLCQVDAHGNQCTDTGWAMLGWLDPGSPLAGAGAAAPSKQVDIAVVKKKLAGFRDRMCACKDAACADKIQAAFQVYLASLADVPRPGKADEEAIVQIATEYEACRQRNAN